MKELNKTDAVQAGKDLTAILLDMCENDNGGNVFIRNYLESLTSDSGIYHQQQDAMEKFSRDSAEMEKNAEQIAESARQNNEQIHAICTQFKTFVDTIKQLTANQKAMNEKVVSLDAKIRDINKFIANIQDISEQTNLLSFNASIEAVRAGEAGKGFRIIANEVKKLSDSTTTISHDIATQVTALNKDIQEVVKENNSHNSFFEQLRTTSGDSNMALEQISEKNETNAVLTRQMLEKVTQNTENIVMTAKNTEEQNINQIKQLADNAAINEIRNNDRLSFLLEMKALFNFMSAE